MITKPNDRLGAAENRLRLSRRSLLGAGAAAASTMSWNWPATAATEAVSGADDRFSFLIISDTHLLAQRDSPGRIDEGSAALNDRLIEAINELSDQSLPEQLGGGTVDTPRGVIHLGDVIDTGDKSGSVHDQMADTEWKHYVDRYGLTGEEGKLRFPIYEIHGNHDSPRKHNVAIDGIMQRNADRSGLKNISGNGLHYSWDWGRIHFVALGIVVGPNDDDLPISRYDSYQSLPFLIADLEKHVGNSGRPVVLLHHIDLHRYARPCEVENAGASRTICCNGMAQTAWCSSGCEGTAGISREEWSHCDVAAYHRSLQPYNIAAIFHGHLHARRTDRWDGSDLKAPQGIPVFGSNNSGAGGGDRSLFYCRAENHQLTVYEYRSRGEQGWDKELAELYWNPEAWHVPLT
jgi:cytolysin (calcineurin-like family phosphatase)